MIDLWCVLDFERRGWGRDFVRAAAGEASALPDLITEIALDEPDVFLMGRRRSDQCSIVTGREQTTIVLGTLYDDPSALTWEALKDDPPRGLYQLLFWDARRRELRITSDVMGARRLYYARREAAWILSTTLGAFRHAPGGKPAPDRLAIAEILTLCHPLGDRTLLEGVTHVPALRALVFSPHGLSEEPRRDAWSAMPSPADWSVEQSADALEEALDSAVAGWTQNETEINIALTGGADSRLLLPFVRRHVGRVRASTFGDLSSLEVTVAQRLCEQTQTVHHLCDLGASDAMSSDQLASFALETEWVGDSVGPFYWRQWLAFLKAQRIPVLTGYLGGVGGRLLSWGIPPERLFSKAEAVRDDLARYPTDEGKALMPFAHDAFRMDFGDGVGARLASVYSSLPGDEACERLRTLELSQRQRRSTSWFPELYEKSVRTVHPFMTRSVLDVFARIPLKIERAAVQAVLARTLPGVLHLPDSNTGRRIAHRGRLDFWRDAAMHNRYTTRLAERLGRPDRLAFATFRRRIDGQPASHRARAPAAKRRPRRSDRHARRGCCRERCAYSTPVADASVQSRAIHPLVLRMNAGAKKVLMIVPAFPPDNTSATFRPMHFARNLPEFGYWPLVLVQSKLWSYPQDEQLRASVDGRCDVFRVAPTTRSFLGPVNKPLRWCLSALRAGLQIRKQRGIDLIWSTSPSIVHWYPAVALSLMTGTPLVLDVRDPATYGCLWNPKNAWQARARRLGERACLSAASRIVHTSPLTMTVMGERAGSRIAQRMVSIPNGFSGERVEPIRDLPGRRCTFLYAGKLERRIREPRILLEGLKIACRHPAFARDACMEIVGGLGEFVTDVTDLALGDNVRDLGYLDRHECQGRIAGADVLVLLQTISGLGDDVISGKAYEYLAARRPILGVVPPNGGDAWLLREMRSGRITGSANANDVAEGFLHFWRLWSEGNLSTSETSRKHRSVRRSNPHGQPCAGVRRRVEGARARMIGALVQRAIRALPPRIAQRAEGDRWSGRQAATVTALGSTAEADATALSSRRSDRSAAVVRLQRRSDRLHPQLACDRWATSRVEHRPSWRRCAQLSSIDTTARWRCRSSRSTDRCTAACNRAPSSTSDRARRAWARSPRPFGTIPGFSGAFIPHIRWARWAGAAHG